MSEASVQTPTPEAVKPAASPLPPARLWMLPAVVVLASLGHLLLWHQFPGLGLVAFLALLGLALIYSRREVVDRPRLLVCLGLLVAALLPLAERLSPLSAIMAVLGLMGLLLMANPPAKGLAAALRVMISWPLFAAFDLPVQGWAFLSQTRAGKGPSALKLLGALVLPLVALVIFGALIVAGNPVMSDWLGGLSGPDLSRINPFAILFWLVLVAFSWPVLRSDAVLALWARFAPHDLWTAGDAPVALPKTGLSHFITPASVALTLGLLNALFLIQIASDLAYLWGGARLPEGLTYAQYAYRGVWTLTATGVLTLLFALGFSPLAKGSALVKGLLLLWLVQTVVLLVFTLLRLDLYVDAYGLTYRRIAGFLLMVLCGVFLALTAVMVIRAHTRRWLVGLALWVTLGTFWGLCFVNLADGIVRHNVARAWTLPDRDVDIDYLCGLGEDAGLALRAADPRQPEKTLLSRCEYRQRDDLGFGWRSDSLRDFRRLAALRSAD